MIPDLEKYKGVQRMAKNTIAYLRGNIRSGMTEKEIVVLAEDYLKKQGVDSFWYYGVGAFVFVGKRTTISMSGREYAPTDTKVKDTDIVTVDLSPEKDGFWGDFARTIVIENGKVVGAGCGNREFNDGWKAEKDLHRTFMDIVKPGMSFEEAYAVINVKITELGYENLDFNNNLGHTIEKQKEDRRYFEKGDKTLLRDVDLFTLEPHIRKTGGEYGFKRENIYYFDNGEMKSL